MFDATELTQIIGPTLAVVVMASAGALLRTRMNSHRLSIHEQKFEKLEMLPGEISELRIRIEARDEAQRVFAKQNEKEHSDITREVRTSKEEIVRAINGLVRKDSITKLEKT
jgi:hypothetical protein